MKFNLCHALILSAALSATACVEDGSSVPKSSLVSDGTGTGPGTTVPTAQAPTQTPPASKPVRTFATDALVFNGTGAWSAEASSLESILSSHGATYREVNSGELDAMTLDELATFGAIVFPGGSGGSEAGSLSSATHARLRAAVQERGVSYIGFCAGAFIGQAPAPKAGGDVSYGLGIVDGPELGYYYLENQGVTIAMTMETFADGSKHDLIWYGGPVTTDIKGGVVAKYPDGNPAISEMWSGNGFVILSGPHPAAPQSTRTSFGLNDTDGTDFELAWTLLSAAIHQQPLAAF